MKLDHVALYVHDLEAMRGFYERYFGAVANAKYHTPKTGLETYFLSFEGGARMEIMARPEVVAGTAAPSSAGSTHLALSPGSKEKGDALTD